jgi:hypothetical protein
MYKVYSILKNSGKKSLKKNSENSGKRVWLWVELKNSEKKSEKRVWLWAELKNSGK